MDFSFIESLKNVSPIVLGIVGVLWLVNRSLNFVETRQAAKKGSDHDSLCAETNKCLNKHIADHTIQTEKMSDLLEKVVEQLVMLNSTAGRKMPKRNQRLLVAYQWNWFRDEVVRHAANSIRRNNVKGREEDVVFRLITLWRDAAKDAVESVAKLEGITLPFYDIVDSNLERITSSVWQWMLPLYGIASEEMLEQSLDNLELRVKALFEELFQRAEEAIGPSTDTDADLRPCADSGTSLDASGFARTSLSMVQALKEHVAQRYGLE